MSAIWQRLMRLNVSMSIENIKQFCKHLSAYNVVRVEFCYDGSGDSGDFDTIDVITMSTPEQIDLSTQLTSDPGKITSTEKRTNGQQWLENVVAQKNSLITKDAYDAFVDDVFSLLPGGWEINDGSYGDIVINVADESVTIEHNERYTDVRTDTFEYR